eukprot:UN32174
MFFYKVNISLKRYLCFLQCCSVLYFSCFCQNIKSHKTLFAWYAVVLYILRNVETSIVHDCFTHSGTSSNGLVQTSTMRYTIMSH